MSSRAFSNVRKRFCCPTHPAALSRECHKCGDRYIRVWYYCTTCHKECDRCAAKKARLEKVPVAYTRPTPPYLPSIKKKYFKAWELKGNNLARYIEDILIRDVCPPCVRCKGPTLILMRDERHIEKLRVDGQWLSMGSRKITYLGVQCRRCRLHYIVEDGRILVSKEGRLHVGKGSDNGPSEHL